MKPSTLRKITIVIIVLGLIGGIVLGFKFKTINLSYYGGSSRDFNVTLMLSVWIGTVLYAIPCFALAAILENQESMTSELWKQSHAIVRPTEDKMSKIFFITHFPFCMIF